MKKLCLAAVLLSVMVFSARVSAQDSNTPVETNVPPFGSADGDSFSTVNLATLNVHFSIPIFSRGGRGIPLKFAMSYDTNAAYRLVTNGGYQFWNFDGGWLGDHWHIPTVITGRALSTGQVVSCIDDQGNPYVAYPSTIYAYLSPDGVRHLTTLPADLCNITYPLTQTTLDGSGYTIVTTRDGNNAAKVTVYPRSGGQIVPADNNLQYAGYGTGFVMDTNGNTISTDVSWNITDTLGTVAFMPSGWPNDGSYLETYTYTGPSGYPRAYSIQYVTTPVTSSFGCGGFEYSDTTQLVGSITAPDGSLYTFGTDAAGRITTVNLPTGGAVNYNYGTYCAPGAGFDGAPQSMRVTAPGTTWTYSRGATNSNGLWTTTKTGDGNVTTYTFQAAAKKANPQSTNDYYANYYEVSRTTCYGDCITPLVGKSVTYSGANNTSAGPSGGTLMLPITQTSTTGYAYSLSGTSSSTFVSTTLYNSYGLPTQSDVWDYNGGAHLKGTTTAYAALGNNIYNRPSSVTITKNGVQQAKTVYTYTNTVTASGAPQLAAITGDRGNVSQVQQWVSGTIYLTKSFTYYDTGNVATATDVNGAVTTYSYAGTSCGQTFATSITRQVGGGSPNLTTSAAWNCTGGVQTSSTDENGKVASTAYNDSWFWRPTSTTDKAGNVTTMSYLSPTQSESVLNFNSGTSTIDILTTLDTMGRLKLQQQRLSPGNSNFLTIQNGLDGSGRPSTSWLPFVGTAGQTSSSGANSTLSWDPATRLSDISETSGLHESVTYDRQYATITTDGSGSAPQSKRIAQMDALGRVATLCEVTSGSGTVSCSTGSGTANGYLTTYTYDGLGNVLTITTQTSGGTQTRSFTYDGLGRTLTETYPESGTTTYAYDSSASCSGSSSGDRVQRTDAVGNVACYTYDLQHRKTSITYSGPYASRTPNRYFAYDAATVNGFAMANAAGRLAEAYTCTTCTPTPTKITDVGFSYTARGEVGSTYQSSPNSGGYYNVSATYWAHGKPQTVSGVPGVPAITYGVDGMGRPTTASASSGQNPVTGLTYTTMNQVTGITFGSGDSDTYTYNPSSGRMTGFSFNVNGQSLTGTIAWNNNGTVWTFATTDPFNSSNNGTCTFGYDDMVRVSSANCVPTSGPAYWSQVFSFDPFGNITKTGSSSWTPTYQTTPNNNRYNTIPGVSGNNPYDSNGNLLRDGSYSYDWNAFGKTSAISGNSGTISVTYDALGRQVEQNNGGTYTQIVYDAVGAKIATMNGQTLAKGFVKLPTGATAVYQSTGLAWYRHSDNIGSSRLATTPTRTIAGDRAYAPYGEAFNETGVQDRSFTGKDEDTAVGLYDFPARRYSPTQGRWLSPDPAGATAYDATSPQTLNRYAYVSNNPLSLVDPEGLSPDSGCDFSVWDFDFNFQGGWSGSFTSTGDPFTSTGTGDIPDPCVDLGPEPLLFIKPTPTPGPSPAASCSAGTTLAVPWLTSPSAYASKVEGQADNPDFLGSGPGSCLKAIDELGKAEYELAWRYSEYIRYGDADHVKPLKVAQKRVEDAVKEVQKRCKCEIAAAEVASALKLLQLVVKALAEFCIAEPEVCIAPAI